MGLIGREKEQKVLLEAYDSKEREVVAVLGRRRVGKTYLINETLADYLCFEHVGLSPAETERIKKEKRNATALELQLKEFYLSLRSAGMGEEKLPTDWQEAFFLLKKFLSSFPKTERLAIFIDELPWMDTPKSFFLTAFEGFLNSYANKRKVMVVVCGSASSWMLNRFIHVKGGLYGRVTRQIWLSPLSLADCEKFLINKGVLLSRYDIALTYMVFGGIPYYLNHMKRGASLLESVRQSFFEGRSPLRNEFEELFSSAFDDADLSMRIVRALFKKRIGMPRSELKDEIGLKDGGRLSKALKGLMDGDIILQYRPLQEEESTLYYKLIDPFCSFYLRFVEQNQPFNGAVFSKSTNSMSVVVWRGLAFEDLCFGHIHAIKKALKIEGVETKVSTFLKRGDMEERGAQIDLLLVRNDHIVDLCEMKFVGDEYSVSAEDEKNLARKEIALSKFLLKKQIIHRVLITPFGIKDGVYRHSYSHVITFDDLFQD